MQHFNVQTHPLQLDFLPGSVRAYVCYPWAQKRQASARHRCRYACLEKGGGVCPPQSRREARVSLPHIQMSPAAISTAEAAFKEATKVAELEWLRFPWTDKWIPPNNCGLYHVCLVSVIAHLREGRSWCTVMVGRAGQDFPWCILVLLGLPSFKAIAHCRRARPGTLYNPLQLFYVWRFALLVKAGWFGDDTRRGTHDVLQMHVDST